MSTLWVAGATAMLVGTAGTLVWGGLGGRYPGRWHLQQGRVASTIRPDLHAKATALLIGGGALAAVSFASRACGDARRDYYRCKVPIGVIGYSLGVSAMAIGAPLLSYARTLRREATMHTLLSPMLERGSRHRTLGLSIHVAL